MKKTSRKILRIMVIMMIVAVVLGGCGESSSGNIQQNVTVGKKVFADTNGTLFFGYGNMICTAKAENSEVTDLTPVFTTRSPVYSLAAYKGYLYIINSNSIIRYPLSTIENGTDNAVEEIVTSGQFDADHHFEIYEDNIFIINDNKLGLVPVDGGNIDYLYEDVYDFEITDKGIYYVQKDGDLHVISSDFAEESKIGKFPRGAKFTLCGSNLFYINEDIVESYSVKKNSNADTGNAKDAYGKSVPWSNGTNIFYSDSNSLCYLITPSGEQEIGKVPAYPDKSEGYIMGDSLISLFSENRKLQMIDLSEGKVKVFDLEKSLSKGIAQQKTSGENETAEGN